MVWPLMKKNLKDFDKYFYIALKKSRIKLDYNTLTVADLKQECYIVYDRIGQRKMQLRNTKYKKEERMQAVS